MPTYTYEGLNKEGKVIKGIKEAPSKTSLLMELKNAGVLVSDVTPSRTKKRISILSIFGNKKKYIPDIFFQIALLLKSGIPLVEAIKVVAESVGSERLKKFLLDVSSTVSEGSRFSVALEKYKYSLIDEMYINLIRVSENIGRLADVLLDIVVYEEEKKKAFDKIRSALVYPITVFVLGLGVVGFLLSYVVPKMEKVFSSVNREIPASTQILIFSGEFIKNYGIFIAVFLLLFMMIIRYLYTKNNIFRFKIDSKLYNIRAIREILLAKFTHVFSFLLREGLPLTDALKSASSTVNNIYLRDVILEVQEDVKGGMKMSKSMESKKIFPELFLAAVVTGESSGNLPGILERVSEFYSKKVEKFSSAFISVIEPLFIVFIGLIVGFIVISIMGPLFELNTLIK
ncbi:MAG: type II secretion system F family protein [Deferribacterota bacterium]|nr:type II secretion system F family protein [Deferribacterota bacterium]